MSSAQDQFIKISRHAKKESQAVEMAHEIDVVTKEEVKRIKKKAQDKMGKQNRSI